MKPEESRLNEYAQKERLELKYEEVGCVGPDHIRTFTLKAVVNGKPYPEGVGKNKKEAKQSAAKNALVHLLNETSVSVRIIELMKSSECKITNSDSFKVWKFNWHNTQRERFLFLGHIRVNKTYYESIEQLDKGAFGRVFKAKRKLEGKYYAVKIVKTLEEVKVLSELNHCNIVRYHSCWLEDTAYQWDASTDSSSASQSSTDQFMKYLYIQMELCEIKTLRVWIDEKNIQNPKKSLRDSRRREESVDIMVQMVSGVEHIHTNKLIHRDLKPANIMFSQNGTVKIGDFGLVTSEIEDDAENQKERRGYKGTPSYMAPEQERRLYDRKVDIFALGLIFFELLWNIPTIHEKEKTLINQMIKSMLCEKPEERPEASKIKTDLEEHKRLLAELKIKQLDSKTVI
uniref:Interferon-induced, double-stranded RNA-activated protein kinase-like n=1 Tax=Poecilia latipinna TaxID=48699 RepID=A0A3B3UYG8_9TELE